MLLYTYFYNQLSTIALLMNPSIPTVAIWVPSCARPG